MAMKNKVVVADSGISAQQMKDFWRKVEDGTIDGGIFQKFLTNPRRFDQEQGVTLIRAINILGQNKVITPNRSAKEWGMKSPGNIPIRFRVETLRQCAEENNRGEDWRLIYCSGLSLHEQHEMIGTDRKKQPCFAKDSIWWLKSDEEKWATQTPEAGYYLINVHGLFENLSWQTQKQEIVKINVRGLFKNLSWQTQEQEIVKLGQEYERCHEAVFAEAILTIFQVSGERIAEDWWHWGSSASSRVSHVFVGRFSSDGLNVGNDWDANYRQNLRVCVARKFDF